MHRFAFSACFASDFLATRTLFLFGLVDFVLHVRFTLFSAYPSEEFPFAYGCHTTACAVAFLVLVYISKYVLVQVLFLKFILGWIAVYVKKMINQLAIQTLSSIVHNRKKKLT